ncbi:hypothetical protein BD560DRAFT_80382 [Blakeslea trispora]|nr:hypothetical protein BD560DRAFT_80382 [Blakeslea trispora]
MRELSSFASFNNLYGVVIRFSRSNQAKDSVIVNPNVNLIFLYEPIMGPLPDIQQLHNGTNEVPRVFNLINMNSAEQNLCDRIEDKVELDPNRPISHIERGFLNNIFNHGVKFIPVGDPMLWNPHLADGLAQWIKRNRKEPYDPYYLPLPKNMSSKGRKVVCSSDISSWVDYSAIDTEANNGAFLRQPEVTSKTSTPHEMAAPIVAAAAAAAAERPSAPPTVAGSSVQKRALNKSDASVSETNKKPRIQEDATEEQNTVMVKSEEVKDTSLMETDEDQNTTTPNSFMANLDSIFEKALNQFELDLENIKVNI